MVREMHYAALSLILQSWEKLKEIPDHKVRFGTLVYLDLFKRCPETRALFGFDSTDPDDVQLAASPKFRANAINLTTMLDTAVDMLGPDQDTLTEILKRLGERHRDSYGVKPSMYSHMRESLIGALISLLGDEYMTKDLKDAWHEAFHLFAADMAPDESEDDWHTEVFKAH